MSIKNILIIVVLLPVIYGQYEYEEELLYGTFPSDFKWGVATSAYQIEGAYNEGGKSLSIWDTFAAGPGNVADGSDGKVACDSYHKYDEDVQLIKEMGAGHYRFSIAWTRILPNGVGSENAEGIQYYKNLIAALKANGITPVATLYHWDLPQELQDQGGWLNPDSTYWFAEYARVCYREFGDDVKLWITLNEPWIISVLGHGDGVSAPGMTGIGDKVYTVTHNLLRAHAKAYRVYENEFSALQNGQVGITLNGGFAEPLNPDDPTHIEAADTDMQFGFGWFAHPIFVNGEYPPIMREKIDYKSEMQGFSESRLPHFTTEDAEEILGTSDFLGLNFYSGGLVFPQEGDINWVSYYADKDTGSQGDANFYPSGSSWLAVTPVFMRRMVNWLADQYGRDLPIYVTENGFSDRQGNLDDMHRIYYYKHYINQLLKAIDIDGVNVKGYFAWSLMDNFEWGQGYIEKFGLHSVDFDNSDRPREAKESSRFLKQLFQDNGFVQNQ